MASAPCAARPRSARVAAGSGLPTRPQATATRSIPQQSAEDFEPYKPPPVTREASRILGLNVQQQALRIFEVFLHAHEKCDSFATVDEAVVVRERQIHHRANLDLVVDHDRTGLDLVHAQNAGLR